MPIANTGAVKFSELAAEFGGSAPHSFSEFYRAEDNTGAVPSRFGEDVEETYTVELNTGFDSGGSSTASATFSNLNTAGRVYVVAGNYYNLRVNFANQHIKTYNGGSSNATAFGWFESPAQNSTGSTSTRSGITIGHSANNWALKHQRAGSNWCDVNQSDCHWNNDWSGHYFTIQGVATANMTLRFKTGSRGSDNGSGSNNRNFLTSAGCSVSNQGGTATVPGTPSSYSFDLGGTLGTVSGSFSNNQNADNSAQAIVDALNNVSGVTATRSGRTMTIKTGRYQSQTRNFGVTQHDGSNANITSDTTNTPALATVVNTTVPASGSIKMANFRGTRKTQ